jgi:hypothetical protein
LPALADVEGLELFPQVPEGETLLNKKEGEREKERERERCPESSTVAKPWWGCSPEGQTPLESQMIMATS